MLNLGTRTDKVRKSILAGTSTALDVLYEVTGRKVKTLQKGAAFLYDLSVDEEEVATVTYSPDVEATAEPEAEASAPADDEALEAAEPEAQAEAAAPEADDDAEPEAVEAAAEPEEEAAPDMEAAPEAEEAEVAEPEAEEEAEVAFPIEGYDEMNVRDVNEALEGLNAAQLRVVRDYEADNKGRVTVDRAIRKLLDD